MTRLNQFLDEISIRDIKKYPGLIWDILQEYPDYLDDTMDIKTTQEFYNWFENNIVGGISAFIKTKYGTQHMIGFSYLTSIENGNGCINLVMKRKAIPFPVAIELYKKYMNFFIDKYNLKMLYAIVRENNLACLQLLKILGFKITTTLKDHEMVNGKLIDCVLATYIREFE